MKNTDALGHLSYRRRNLRRIFTAGMDEIDMWGHPMEMEFIDHVARETVVPVWWFPAWDLGLLWATWVPPRVRNAAAQRLAALLPPGIKDPVARTMLLEFSARAEQSPTAVLQDWLFPEGIHIAAADAPPPFTWLAWQPLSLAPEAFFVLPSLELAEEAGQWLLHAARNDARRNLLGWAPDGPHGRRRPEKDRPWTEVRARTRQEPPSLGPGADLALLPSDDLPQETLIEIRNLLQALGQVASPKERQVLDLLRSGFSPEDIATSLDMTRSTVDVHCFNLRQKCAQL
jgi:DNA-binding CsgD family transcriptional regulator